MNKQAYDAGVLQALKDAGLTKLAMDRHLRHSLMTGAAGAVPITLTGGITGAVLAPEGQGGRGFWGPAMGGFAGLLAGGALARQFGAGEPAQLLSGMLGKGLGAGLGYHLAVDE